MYGNEPHGSLRPHLTCLLVLAAAVVPQGVRAQPRGADAANGGVDAEPVNTPTPAHTDQALPASHPAKAPSKVWVHLDTGGDAGLGAALDEALRAQFAAIAAELSTATDGDSPVDMPSRMRAGRAAAEQHGAFAVFWIEARPQAPWILYMMDPSGDRLLARELPGEEGATNASVEAAAVIVASATGALLRGEPVELRIAAIAPPQTPTPAPAPLPVSAPAPVAPPPQSPQPAAVRATPATTPPPLPARMRLWMGYRGQAVATDLPWVDAIAVELGARPWSALWVGLGYAHALTDTVQAAAPFELRRDLARLSASYAWPVAGLTLEPGIAIVMDVLRRHSLAAEGNLEPRPDQTRILWAAEPALAVAVEVGPETALRLRLGSEIIFNNFEYIAELPEERVQLAPRDVQPSLELGLSMRF